MKVKKKKQIKNGGGWGGGGGGGGGGDTLKQSKLGHWEQEFKSIETRAKDELKKKVEWFKENWMVEKANKKLSIPSHERSNEHKKKNTEISRNNN